MESLGIILLSIGLILQSIVIHWLNKDVSYLKQNVLALHAILHKKFDITVTESVHTLKEYAEKEIDFTE